MKTNPHPLRQALRALIKGNLDPRRLERVLDGRDYDIFLRIVSEGKDECTRNGNTITLQEFEEEINAPEERRRTVVIYMPVPPFPDEVKTKT